MMGRKVQTKRAAFLAPVLLLACAAGSGDWPRWRGPEGSAVADGWALPVRWGVAWKAALAGEGASSPIVLGDAIFLTFTREHGTRRALECRDARTGESRWVREVRDENPERSSALTGHAAPTPVTDGERVVAFFGNAGVVCTDLSGALLWHRRLGEFDSELGIASSPILHRGCVILVCDHDGDRFKSFDSFLIALDARTGATVWKTERPGLERSWSTPIVAGAELIVSAQDELRAYDPRTGGLLWKVEGMSGWVTPSPVFGKGMIFATSGKNGPTVAIRPGGEVVWREPVGGPYVCSPLLYGDLLYLVEEDGRVTCREAESGALVWRGRLRGKFFASPVAGDGKIYAANDEGVTFVVKAGRTFEILTENRLDEECLASPAISRGSLFLRTRRHLYRIRRE